MLVGGGVPVGIAAGRRPGGQTVRPDRQRHRPGHHGSQQRPLRQLGLLEQDQHEHDRGQERRLLGMVATILNVIPATKAAMNLLPSVAAAV